jgi:DNA (cytosine-5)-methyltransferase 1
LDSSAKELSRSHSSSLMTDAELCSGSTGRMFLRTETLVISAGFPCQDLSVAGKRSGLAGSRSSLMFALTWVVVENVAHTWRRWVPELRRHLHRYGWASVPLQLSAREVGGRHLRRRVFVVAHANGEQLRELSRWWSREGRQVADELAQSWDSAPRGLGANDGLPDWVDRRKQLGNAVVPHAAQLIARAVKSFA